MAGLRRHLARRTAGGNALHEANAIADQEVRAKHVLDRYATEGGWDFGN